jgi:diguanylate cyclase (GGDEF)-like protein
MQPATSMQPAASGQPVASGESPTGAQPGQIGVGAQSARAEQPDLADEQPGAERQGAGKNTAHEMPAPADGSGSGKGGWGAGLTGLELLGDKRRAFAACVAGLCVVAGIIASVLGAKAVAHSNAESTRNGVPRTAAGIASALKLAVQREEELGVSASTYFAGNPKATAREFDKWLRWAHTLRRFPELQSLGLVAIVRAPEVGAFSARVSGHHRKSHLTLVALPAGHTFGCLSAVELSRRPLTRAPAGFDYCAATPGLLTSRDTGKSVYTQISGAGSPTLAIETPVYRGNALPLTRVGRRAAFVGWLREVLVPGAVMGQVLAGHPGYSALVRYGAGSANVTYVSGTPRPGTGGVTITLHNGWSVQSFGPTASESVFDHGDSLALLLGGILLSGLVGALIFLLGGGSLGGLAPEPVEPQPGSDLYDPLTGLPNRALTLDRAERMVSRAGRHSGMLAGALLIDIDWFKEVNEKLGRDAGDQLLKTFARRLEGVIRAEDTVGRYGGDEFVVLVESAARGVRLDSLAGRMIEALHKPVALDDFGPGFFATASIGVAFGRYEGPDDLLRDAQLALLSAKSAGKDRYTLFNANMRAMIESRGVLDAELNAALLDDEFLLLYQPIFHLRTRRVAGLEAQIRWMHPRRGMVMPEDFVPIAEENGLIVPIGRWALEQACARTAAWNVDGHQIGVSVKVTANQLNREAFVTDVRRALQQSGIDPAKLTLEISESAVIRDIEASSQHLEELKRLGVRIAIEDFGGSGYARHSDLQRMPIDVLKVDRSSLAASDDEAYRNWLLEAILITGRELSLEVIATDIENHAQVNALQEMGCTMAQGYFLGKPTSSEGVAHLFDTTLDDSLASLPAGQAPAGQAPAGEPDGDRAGSRPAAAGSVWGSPAPTAAAASVPSVEASPAPAAPNPGTVPGPER